MTIGIILVNYHTAQLTLRLIDSIKKFDTKRICSVVIVDNSVSREERNLLLKADRDSVSFIFTEENIGFARACNIGAERLVSNGTEYLFFINTDVILTTPTLYEIVRKLNEHVDIHLISPVIHAFPKKSFKPWFCGAKISKWNGKIKDISVPSGQSLYETDFISGCFLALRTADWRKLKGFDERFFMYVEDVELSLRARKLGMKLVVIPQLEIMHEVGGSQVEKTELRGLSVKNQNFLFHLEHKFRNRLLLYRGSEYFFNLVYFYWAIDLFFKSMKFFISRPRETKQLLYACKFIINGKY
ncbi:glycosyltransferase family 2 protein [Schleiferiaceae bacterium]|nr:glycosyltransferase family 2 protein [Schleiferiaceae bacterium]